MLQRSTERTDSSDTHRFLRDTGELSKHACGGKMLAHLQAFEALLITFRPTDRLKLGASFQVNREKTGVKTHRISRGVSVIQQAQSGRLQGLDVALWRFQARETPPRTEMLALLCRHGQALDMVVEREAPTGSQQGSTALEQGRAPRNVAPYIEAHDDVKARLGQGDGMNVPKVKLH